MKCASEAREASQSDSETYYPWPRVGYGASLVSRLRIKYGAQVRFKLQSTGIKNEFTCFE